MGIFDGKKGQYHLTFVFKSFEQSFACSVLMVFLKTIREKKKKTKLNDQCAGNKF